MAALLPIGVVSTCEARVAALRGRQPGPREGDVALDTKGFDVITTVTHGSCCTYNIPKNRNP
ncbi:hypothetical protein PF005_g1316 [Phytophthora fragariae]|uniref:Uncharacterized protein n=1 Tax=Phytophthora fragariae TaxID=53985 RepID=A0A6A3ZJ45_9STRA|nr:hypothetical protein PF003_g25960 [Phytophthora fragariae]KAE8949082.1 hypothetical protein PF009_g1341 [Phytophthora fragariae]KAE9020117.1 hypothetical protein PF011_g5553 [Phytophthora fragariae]KAE9138118.1 hypothetical protein PF010_g1047 [Phytophthora fragariae]KAE9138784.1 hypothetical protein PF007_g1243 [Phytophthora fragariae]